MRHLLLLALLLPGACADFTLLGPGDRPTSLRAAQASLAGGLPEGALSVARRHLQDSPRDVGAVLMEGQALVELGRLNEAEASFRHAADLWPRSAGAQFGLGRVLLLSGQAAEAEAAFQECLDLRPADPRTLNNLGIARDMQAHHTDAQQAYAAALRAAPDSDAARVNLGLSLALSDNPAEGAKLLGPLAADPSAPRRIHHDFAVALALSGDRAAAEAQLRPDIGPAQMAGVMADLGALRAAGAAVPPVAGGIAVAAAK